MAGGSIVHTLSLNVVEAFPASPAFIGNVLYLRGADIQIEEPHPVDVVYVWR